MERGQGEAAGLHPEEAIYALTTTRYTFLLGDLGRRVEVYDRASDPGQRHDTSRISRDVTKDLRRQFEAWAATQRVRPIVLPGGEVYVAQEQVITPEERTREHLRALGYLK